MTFSFRDRVGGSSYLVFGVAKLCSSPRAQCPVYALGEGGLSGLGVRCVWGTVYIYCWLSSWLRVRSWTALLAYDRRRTFHRIS